MTLTSLVTAALDTGAPWWSPHLPVLRELVRVAASRSFAAALNEVRDADVVPVRFAAPSELQAGEAYESFVARTACVPTRDNLHDLLNGLMWLRYPRTKARLNALQSREIAQHGTSGRRGALRDALTVFDENAALLIAPVTLADALRARDWNSLFVAQRREWEATELVLFGHALLEKLLQPRKAITAHVWLVDDLSDDAVAASLTRERLGSKPFLPLPVLGVPGWWSENEDPAFYEDSEVFRRLAR